MQGLKKILFLLRNYKKEAILNVLFNGLSTIFGLFSILMIIPFLGILFDPPLSIGAAPEFGYSSEEIGAYFQHFLTELVVSKGPQTALLTVCAFILLNSLFKNLFRYAGLFVLAKARYGIVRDLRKGLFDKIVDLPVGYFTEKKRGDIQTRITSDVQEVEVSILNVLEVYFKEPITITVYLGTLLFISPALTGIVLVLTPISGLVIGRLARKLRKNSQVSQKVVGELTSMVDETLHGLRILIAFAAEPFQVGRFKKLNDQHYGLQKKMVRQRNLASPMSEFFGTAVVVCVLFIGAKMVLGSSSALNAEAFVGYLVVFTQIINPAKSFSTAYFNYQKGLASLERIEQVLAEKNIISSPKTPTAIPIGKHNIKFENVSFSYDGKKEVLHSVSFEIPFGNSIALVGKSGSGKSTLADLLCRFYDPTSGRITYGGIDIREFDVREWRGMFGMVSQEAILFNDSLSNNISFGRSLTESQIQTALETAHANEFSDSLEDGIDTNLGEKGAKLSGGQRQRVTIARAVASNPPILVLDEATSALDSESEQFVQKALDNILNSRTALVIAHRLSTIQHANVILVMQEGRVVEQGSHQELVSLDGVYGQLVRLQNLG